MNNLEGLAEKEKRTLLSSSFGVDRIMLMLLFDTGLEVEDLIGIKTSDIDLEIGTILVRSTGEKRRISPGTLTELQGYLKTRPGQAYLFEGRCGKPMTAKWKRCVLEKRIKGVADKGKEIEKHSRG